MRALPSFCSDGGQRSKYGGAVTTTAKRFYRLRFETLAELRPVMSVAGPLRASGLLAVHRALAQHAVLVANSSD